MPPPGGAFSIVLFARCLRLTPPLSDLADLVRGQGHKILTTSPLGNRSLVVGMKWGGKVVHVVEGY